MTHPLRAALALIFDRIDEDQSGTGAADALLKVLAEVAKLMAASMGRRGRPTAPQTLRR